jgi:leukotriene-A4 hydrolase
MTFRTAILGLVLPLLSACSSDTSSPEEATQANVPTAMTDPHSNARPAEAVIKHLDLDIQVDMERTRIDGVAAYTIERTSGSDVVFDTDGLVIHEVTAGNGDPLPFELGDSTLLGRALRVALTPGTDRVKIHYTAGKGSKALQWLAPEQTSGKTHPFLFTQGQAVLARTWIPVQDSPGIRFTYKARVQVPPHLMAVMSATNPQETSKEGVYEFHMEHPVPAYLIALAVGDLAFKPLGERTGVYAEPALLEKAAWEFGDTERMLAAAENLYGPYRWGRYDILVLPPSVPFGGMENPMLTFATPTIIAGDRSLNALIAHELAHSWSGNLVTNATWNDFWLNEGFTVYFENRIVEALYGAEYAGMLAQIGRQDLEHTLAHIDSSRHPEDTHLRLHLEGRDPDEGMTDVAYEKGAAFLRMLEGKVGREKFDAFLRDYFDRFAFTSMSTDKFMDHLQEHLLGPNNVKVDLKAWIDGPGLPPDAPVHQSPLFAQVEAEIERMQNGARSADLATEGWSAFQWLHFLRHLPQPVSKARMEALDKAFHFSESGNAEILAAWLEQCVRNNYDDAYAKLDSFLVTVGRRKFLVPLYTELLRSEKGKVLAHTIYGHARPNYHAVAVHTIDQLLAWKDNKPPVDF